MAKNTINIRSDPNFKKMLDDIKLERIKLGKDTRLLSDRRITLAMSRLPALKSRLLNSDIQDDRTK